MFIFMLFTLFLSVACEDQKKPNFLVILTDDQDVALGGMNPMKNVQRFIGKEGVTFTNSFTTSPICCTNRAVLLTGLDVHNHNRWNNSLPGGCYGHNWEILETKTGRLYDALHCWAWSSPNIEEASSSNESKSKSYNLNTSSIKVFTTSPICCPSRASLLTGLYVHNHHTWNNSLAGGCYGHNWKILETKTFATELSKAGYSTFYAGKYLNEYGTKSAGGPVLVPPGWSEWHGLVGNSVYYNYTMSNNGVPTHSTDLYLTDIIRDLGISFIENQTESQPFLMVLAPPAPHQPFTPADRHKGTFKNVTAVKHPNFNFAATDKHWLMKMPPSPLPETMLPELDRVYRSRWESLLAVDEMVADVVNALETSSFLDDTYLIYTSDNGYHVGQFSQVYDKRQPYEADIRVPLLIRGPGIPKNVKSEQPVLNIDVAPTIFELAGVMPTETVDGRPIEVFNITGVAERNMLVEYYGEGRDGTVDPSCPWSYDQDNLAQCHPQYDCKCQDSKNNTYACLRHLAKRINMKFCIFADKDNFTEMYNVEDDPYELLNIADSAMPSLKHWYKLTLAYMLSCKGADSCDNPLQLVKVF